MGIWRSSRHVVAAAPAGDRLAMELGVPFASENGALHLTARRHSHRWIVHVADATGWAISQQAGNRGRQPQHHPHSRHGEAIDLRPSRHASTPIQRRGPMALCSTAGPARSRPDRPGDGAMSGGRNAPPYSTVPVRRDWRPHCYALAPGCRVSNTGIHVPHPTCLTICR